MLALTLGVLTRGVLTLRGHEAMDLLPEACISLRRNKTSSSEAVQSCREGYEGNAGGYEDGER